MAISGYDNSRSFAGNGTTKVFAFPPPFTANSDLVVLLRAADGTETPQTLATHYTVTGAGSPAGGTVTLTTAPAAGLTLVITRDVPVTQPTTILDGGPFPAGAFNLALDRITMWGQRLRERLDLLGGLASATLAGLMSPADKAKLDSVAAGAQVNAVTSVAGRTGAVALTKADIGLGAADNTSDDKKPVSTAQQAALNLKANTASLAPVATSGAYSDLTGRPTLGTAAAAAANAFATAAQGAKADSALQGAQAGTNISIDRTDPLRPKISAVGAAGGGDVLGPSSATDGRIAVFDGGTGKLIKMGPLPFSGAWADLTGAPTFAAVATSGAYRDLTGVPSLFSGAWTDLTGKPTFAAVAYSGSYSDLTGTPKLIPPPSLVITADTTLTVAQTGSFVRFSSATARTLTLPPAADGFMFLVDNANASVNHIVKGNASETIQVNGAAGSNSISIPPACTVIVYAGNASQVQMIMTIPYGTAASNAVQLDSSGRLPAVSGELLTNINSVWAPGTLYGLTLSRLTAATLGIAVGGARNENTGTGYNLTVATALTKSLSAWAAGTGNGGIDTGTIAASTWYHVWLIRADSGGTIDALLSLSPTAPTMPTGYTARRRIGSIRTGASSQITDFVQVGDRFMWSEPVFDASAAVSSAAAQLVALSVPTGVAIEADIQIAANSTTFGHVLVSSPLVPDAAPSSTAAPYFTVIAASNTSRGMARVRVLTNSSGQIRHRNTATASTTIEITTYGWMDSRGRS